TIFTSGRTGAGTAGFFGGDDGPVATPAGGVEITFGISDTLSTSWQTDQSSAFESHRAYESSLSKGREFTTTATVTREIVGASIDIDLTFKNTGNIPFTMSNIEISVLEQVGNQEKLLPVATLVSNSELITGTPLQINLGALTSEHGPFLFSSREVFPKLVEALMRNPSGLVFRVANYDISDELGRNYTFINQVARDRTGNITLDFGDADAAQQFLVATHGALDTQNTAGGGYVGGFNSSNGNPVGLPMNYVMQTLLGLQRQDTAQDHIVAGANGMLESNGDNLQGDDVEDTVNNVIIAGPNGWLETRAIGDDFVANPTAANGIVAGLNKTADSIAQGDDIQLVPVATTGLSIGTIVVDPGENGVLDTPMLSDDRAEFVQGYETSRSCTALSNKAGDICRIDADCSCQQADSDGRCESSPASVGSCTGPQRLVRVKSLRNGDFNRAWVTFTTGNLPDAADFDLITMNPGDDLWLAFLQDLDSDGLFARNEFLLGSTDSSSDDFVNADFGENFKVAATPACNMAAPACDGVPDSRDTDRDGLSDFAESRVGWRVATDGGALRQVFSSPRFPDSDGDNLLDPVEQDLRRYCETGDPRDVALCAFQSEVVTINEAIGIIAGPDGIADTTADANDEQLTAVGATVAYGTPVVGPGSDGILTTTLAGDDKYESQSSIPPATDPSSSDTDLDGISDYIELDGFEAGLAIVDGGNGIVETPKNGDDIQRAFLNNPVFPGGVIMLPGANSLIDSDPGGDDVERPATPGLTTDPLRRDTDDDTFTDGLELAIGSNPTILDGADFVDSDVDGLTDNEESSLGWLVSVDGATAFEVKSSPFLPDTDFDGLPDFIERDLRTNPNNADTDNDGISDFDEISDFSAYQTLAGLYPGLNIPTVTSGYGTDPTKSDTDGDGLSDYKELIDGIRLLLPGSTSNQTVYTSPVFADTDNDGVGDGAEVGRPAGPTDPTNPDTDGDGKTDGREDELNTDPLVADLSVTIRFERLSIIEVTNDNFIDYNDFQPGSTAFAAEIGMWFTTQGPTDSTPYPFMHMGDIYGSRFFIGNVPNQPSVPFLLCMIYPAVQGFDYSFQLANERTFPLTAGQSFSLNGLVAELDIVDGSCGTLPHFIPTIVGDSGSGGAQCAVHINETFHYADLVSASSSSNILTIQEANACDMEISYSIEVE
ncbi:hypothetical protein, partial [Kaarinaea lacus]